jgi:hypothetical protein
MRHSRFFLLGWLIVLLSACEPTPTPAFLSTGPQSWIDAPLNGNVFPLAPLEIVAHSADLNSIVQMELAVGEDVIDTQPNADIKQTLMTMKKSWQPPAPGDYMLRVRAQDTTGAWGDYAQTIVTIQATTVNPTSVAPLPRVAPSATPTIKPGAPTPSATVRRTSTTIVRTPTRTFTPIPRNTSTPTRTSTPRPPVGCSGTPVIASFSASPSTINAGGSSILSWGAVSNADAVEIDNGIGGVPAPGSTTVSPSITTVYVLTARCKEVTAIARAVVSVIQPPTSTPVIRQFPTSTPTRTRIIVR